MLNHRLGSMFYFCPSIKQANPSKSTMETPISMEVWIERWERQIGSGERTKRRIRNLCSSRILPISSSQKYTQQKPQALRSPTRKEWRKTLDLAYPFKCDLIPQSEWTLPIYTLIFQFPICLEPGVDRYLLACLGAWFQQYRELEDEGIMWFLPPTGCMGPGCLPTFGWFLWIFMWVNRPVRTYGYVSLSI